MYLFWSHLDLPPIIISFLILCKLVVSLNLAVLSSTILKLIMRECDFLLDWDFDSCYFSQDVEVIWSRIKLAILTAIGKFVPIVTVSKRHSHLPRWFNSSVYHDLKRVRTIRRQCVSSPI